MEFDYDKFDELAKVEDEFNVLYDGLVQQEGDEDPWALIEPDEQQEIEEQKGHLGAPLSYKKCKENEFKFHPRDRENKCKFNWLTVDLSYLPLCQGCVKKNDWVTECAKEIGLGPTLFLMT